MRAALCFRGQGQSAMTDKTDSRDLIASPNRVPQRSSSSMPATLELGGGRELDVTGLSPEQVAALRLQHAQNMINVANKHASLGVDVEALNATIGTMASQTKAVSEAGNSATLTHAQSSSLGRTEVVIGNTDRAAAGKLSASQTGLPDRTMLYVIIASVAAIIVALILAGH